MKSVAVGCALLLCVSGCFGRPMQVCTDGRMALGGSVATTVRAEMPVRQNDKPLEAMVVSGEPAGSGCPRLALIDVDGILVNANVVGPYSMGENPVELLREKLDAAAADPAVRAVVVRIQTPGGAVAASDTMRHELEQYRARTGKPVVAFLGDVAAGGGYYLATAADAICAHPAAVTGGIGVVLNLYNLQDTMAYFNVGADPVKAGEQIDLGSPVRGLTPEARAWLQSMADQFHQRFAQAVIQSRPNVDPRDPTTFDGRVFTAADAKARGLIDQIGYLDGAIEAARQRAGIDRASVVMYHRPGDPARSPHAITPNMPVHATMMPMSVPGLERSRLPLFLYMWNLDPTLERLGGAY